MVKTLIDNNQNSGLLTRDLLNERLNLLENNNYHLFSNQIQPVPRPTSIICDKHTIYDGAKQQRVPLIIQPRPTISGCFNRESLNKNTITFSKVNLTGIDNNDRNRPYRDMIWNQMTKRKFIEKDCRD